VNGEPVNAERRTGEREGAGQLNLVADFSKIMVGLKIIPIYFCSLPEGTREPMVHMKS
jgi:hypothetical protein